MGESPPHHTSPSRPGGGVVVHIWSITLEPLQPNPNTIPHGVTARSRTCLVLHGAKHAQGIRGIFRGTCAVWLVFQAPCLCRQGMLRHESTRGKAQVCIFSVTS